MPVPLQTKPPAGASFNSAHPLASGLVRYIPYLEGSGSPIEKVSGTSGTLSGGATWATDANLGGTVLDTTSTNDDGVDWLANGLSYGNGNCTFLITARIPTIAARQHVGIEAAGGSTDGIFFGLNDSGDVQFVLADVFAFERAVSALTVGNIYTMVGVFTRGTSVKFHVYEHNTDTMVRTTVNDTNVPTPSANKSVTANRRNLTGNAWDEYTVQHAIWNYALTDALVDFAIRSMYATLGGIAPRRTNRMVRRPA